MATLKSKILFFLKNNPKTNISSTIIVICPKIAKINFYMCSL